MPSRPQPSRSRRPRSAQRPAGAGRQSSEQIRAQLLEHVLERQQQVRSCAGCGLCCTAAHNAIRILPIEADRIAAWMRTQTRQRYLALKARIQNAIRRFRLVAGKPGRYTCPFLEKDLRCALPFEQKPVACLTFNPITQDHCDQEPKWFRRAHPPVSDQNRRAGLPDLASPIPVAVQDALARPAGGGA